MNRRHGEAVVRVVDDGIDAMAPNVGTTGRGSALSHGSGVGLWYANRIVTRSGGGLRVGRHPDGEPTGTVTAVQLPAARRVEAAARPPTILAA